MIKQVYFTITNSKMFSVLEITAFYITVVCLYWIYSHYKSKENISEIIYYSRTQHILYTIECVPYTHSVCVQ